MTSSPYWVSVPTCSPAATLGEGGKEAYYALKKAIQRIIPPGDIEKLEQNADSDSRRAVIAEELTNAGKTNDPELLRLAQALATEVKAAPKAKGATGITLKDIEAVNVVLKGITATGAGLVITKAKLSGDLRVGNVQAGGRPQGK